MHTHINTHAHTIQDAEEKIAFEYFCNKISYAIFIFNNREHLLPHALIRTIIKTFYFS